jgi:uncharacterized metal-binding protein YceD (DUF177 family)
VNRLNAYNIDIFKLSNATHDYVFEVDSSFFEEFEESLASDGRANVIVKLRKSETMIETNIQVKGSVKVTCDRSLEDYDHHLDTNDDIIFKYGDEWKELSDEIVTIPNGEQRINLAQYIYEFIGLAIPMKRLHPRFEQDEVEDDETNEMIYSSYDENEEDIDSSTTEEVDPRWAKLKEIKK